MYISDDGPMNKNGNEFGSCIGICDYLSVINILCHIRQHSVCFTVLTWTFMTTTYFHAPNRQQNWRRQIMQVWSRVRRPQWLTYLWRPAFHCLLLHQCCEQNRVWLINNVDYVKVISTCRWVFRKWRGIRTFRDWWSLRSWKDSLRRCFKRPIILIWSLCGQEGQRDKCPLVLTTGLLIIDWSVHCKGQSWTLLNMAHGNWDPECGWNTALVRKIYCVSVAKEKSWSTITLCTALWTG